MNINIDLLQFALLLVPGYITRFIANNLSRSTIDIEHGSEIREMLNIFIFSVIDLFISEIVITIINSNFSKDIPNILADVLTNRQISFTVVEVILLTSILVGILCHRFVDKRVLFRVASMFNITNIHSNETAWQYFNNAHSGDWVIVTDYETRKKYIGYIAKYEIDGDDKYIVLSKATVYSIDDKNKRHEAKSILLKCNKDSIVMEVK